MIFVLRSQVSGQLLDTEFQPTVTATCKSGHMTIRVNLNQSFVGAVHARDFRTPQCMAPGNGSTHATLAINLLAPKGSPDYCGVLVNNVSYIPSISLIKNSTRIIYEVCLARCWWTVCLREDGFKTNFEHASTPGVRSIFLYSHPTNRREEGRIVG